MREFHNSPVDSSEKSAENAGSPVDFSQPRRKRFVLTPAMQEATRLGKRLGLIPSHRNLYIWELSILAESELAGICLQEASAVIAANARQAMAFGECVNYHWFEDCCWRNPKYSFKQRDELGSPCFRGRRPITPEDLRRLEDAKKRAEEGPKCTRCFDGGIVRVDGKILSRCPDCGKCDRCQNTGEIWNRGPGLRKLPCPVCRAEISA